VEIQELDSERFYCYIREIYLDVLILIIIRSEKGFGEIKSGKEYFK